MSVTVVVICINMNSAHYTTVSSSQLIFKPNKIEILITKLRQLQEQNIRNLLLLSCFHRLTGKHQREPITQDLDLGV